MNVIKNETQEVSWTKLGLMIMGLAQGIQTAGIDIVASSTIDETILKLLVIIGGVMAGMGARDAIAKAGK